MKIRNILIPLMLILLIAAGASTVLGQEWVKLGEKSVNFKLDHDTIGATGKGKVREIHMRVMYAPIKFTKVVLHYKDGDQMALDYLEDVQVGIDSRSITIEGDGHVIKSIEFWYKTDAFGGKKAKVAVYGRG